MTQTTTEAETEAERTFQEAYHNHYKIGDAQQAAKMYRLLIDRWPESRRAKYAKTQLENLRNQPPQKTAPQKPAASLQQQTHQSLAQGHQYPALDTISMLLKVAAALSAGGHLLAGFYAMSLGSFGVVAGIGAILWGAFVGLICWALAELINLLVDVERNTRISAQESLGRMQGGG